MTHGFEKGLLKNLKNVIDLIASVQYKQTDTASHYLECPHHCITPSCEVVFF